MSGEIEISPEAYDIAAQQVNDAVAYFRLSHYLSRLNYIERLTETGNGCLVIPRKMLTSVAYGFSDDDSVFFIQFAGVLYDLFKQLFPVESMFIVDANDKGIALLMKPVKYADYSYPSLKLFFPIISRHVLDRATAHSKHVRITKIEQSLINPKANEVVAVVDNYVKISLLSDFVTVNTGEENFLRMYS